MAAQFLGGLLAGLACLILADKKNTGDKDCSETFLTIEPRIHYNSIVKPDPSPESNYTSLVYYYNNVERGYWDFGGNKDDIYNVENAQPGYDDFNALLSEATGAFIFIFLFMLCTDKKTQYSDDKVINCFIMAASYCAARLMGAGGLVTVINESFRITRLDADKGCVKDGPWIYMQPKRVGPLLNPAIAFGNMIFSGTYGFWLQYGVMPFVGSIGALFFYEMIFVKTQEYLDDDDSRGSDDLSIDSEQIGGAIGDKKNENKTAEEASIDE